METLPIQHHIEICEHGTECEVCCWNWTAALSAAGYGRTLATCYGKVETYAHRIMWCYYNEQKVPHSMIVTHTCNNKRCCNPTHLDLITYSQFCVKRQEKRQKARAEGKNWGNLKLTREQVETVLEMGKSGGKTQQQIADMMGVSQVNVSYILRGKTWKHLQEENLQNKVHDWIASRIT